MDIIVDSLAGYAHQLRFEDLPAPVITRAKALIVDTLACALGAAAAQPVGIAWAMAADVAAPNPGWAASTLVRRQLTTPDMAAFVNGSMIRYLDFNDTYTGIGTTHPSDMVAPALAVAEAFGLGGQDLILGTVLGYEVLCALTDCGIMMHPMGDVLWDQSTFAAISAAALAARLMGLSEMQTRHAISLATTSHLSLCQVRTGEVSHWKGCAVANASRNAVFCARLAARGMTGPVQVFEGKRGFFKAAGRPMDPLVMGGVDQPYRIMRARTKPYPAGYYAQSAIEAALELRTRVKDVGEIDSLRIETFHAAHEIMGSGQSRWEPETRESADHSLPFTIAMALMHGDVRVEHFDEGLYRAPEVRAFMRRIEVVVGDESERAWPDMPLNVISIRMKSDARMSARVAFHSGHFENPMTDTQQQVKLQAMAARAGLCESATAHMLTQLRALETITDLRSLIALTWP